jgi:transposase
MRTVALDLGVRRTDLCEVNEAGVLERAVIRSAKDLERHLGGGTPSARVVFEACREGWGMADRLRGWGHEPVMVDTTRVRQLGIGQHGRKTNRIDAEALAMALLGDRIPQAHILSAARQELRYELSVRRLLVETRAQYVTAIRGLVRARGGRIAHCATRDFMRRLSEAELDERTHELLDGPRGALDILNRKIAESDLRLQALCDKEPVITSLMTAPGAGVVVAAAFVSVIDEARRFRNAHQVQSYLGLVPEEASTGDRRRLGSISKAGNSYLRSLLVEAAWVVIKGKGDDPLHRWARHVARRRGPRIATVALARRLAGVMWAIWRDGSVYDPEHMGAASARGVERQAQSLGLRAQALRMAARKAAQRRRLAQRALV